MHHVANYDKASFQVPAAVRWERWLDQALVKVRRQNRLTLSSTNQIKIIVQLAQNWHLIFA